MQKQFEHSKVLTKSYTATVTANSMTTEYY